MVAEISTLKEFQELIKKDGLTVMDFHATWCGPCKMISPLIEKYAAELPQAHFYKVDVDAAAEVAEEYQVSSMPTVMFFKGGEKIATVIGANIPALRKTIETNA